MKNTVNYFNDQLNSSSLMSRKYMNINQHEPGIGFPLEPLSHNHRSTSIYSLSEQIDFLNSTSSMDDDEDEITNCTNLANRIESSLRQQCKSSTATPSKPTVQNGGIFEPGEILVPNDLTLRVAESVLRLADDEPCGIRGCVIFIVYDDPANKICRRVGKVRCDPNSVVTFEVTLTLRPDNSSWLRLLPLKSCWRKLRHIGGLPPASLVVGSNFTLTKNKLYRSCCE